MITGKMKNKNKKLNKAQIEHLIPHCGNMILIDNVDSWEAAKIHCRSNSHRLASNPLRLDGKLSAIHLLEYGAQAIAIHGGLLVDTARPGFLAAIRDAHFYIDSLDSIESTITINASAEIKTENGVIYKFSIYDAQQKLLLAARATIIHTQL
jgi:predicted hotdog family 3-hydroxylacyl-ACP dehydratase